MDKNKKIVIVLGLSCSGTSVIAGMLHHIGVNMNPMDNNKSGYPYGSFEDSELQELTRFMAGTNIEPEKKLKKKELKKQTKYLIEKRTEENDIWGFKSTLTYKCLDYFMLYIKNPYLVVIFRNIIDNANSLVKQYATNFGENLSYMAAIEMIIKEQGLLIDVLKKHNDIPAFFTNFEEIEKNFLNICIGLANFLEIEPDFMAFEKLSKLFVDGKTRHGKVL